MLYKILRVYSPVHSCEPREGKLNELESLVQKFIDEGWTPLGGITFNENFFLQAIVKK